MPRAGIYFPGDSIDLIEATAWEGEATLMNLDGTGRDCSPARWGCNIAAESWTESALGGVGRKGYVEEQNGTFVEMGDGN